MAEISIREFLAAQRIAVVGVSRNPQKYGHQVYLDLKRKGYEVYAVNPHCDRVEDDPCYPNLASLPVKVDGVNLVVPPEVGRKVVEECLQLGISRLWFQPGAESVELIRYCASNQMQVVHGQCVIIRSKAC